MPPRGRRDENARNHFLLLVKRPVSGCTKHPTTGTIRPSSEPVRVEKDGMVCCRTVQPHYPPIPTITVTLIVGTRGDERERMHLEVTFVVLFVVVRKMPSAFTKGDDSVMLCFPPIIDHFGLDSGLQRYVDRANRKKTLQYRNK